MNYVVKYEYRSYDLGCGCCSDSDSLLTVWENGVLVSEDVWHPVCQDEEDLRNSLSLEEFTIHEDTIYF